MARTKDRLYSHHIPKTGRRKETEWQLLRRLLMRLAIIILVLTAMYFWGLAVLSNINMFWQALNLEIEKPGEKARVDKIPPSPPLISHLPVATKESKIDVKGFTEEGATVKLFVNDKELEKILADKDGAFAFEGIPLSEGKNTIYTQATDTAGNESQPSGKVTVEFDKIPPNLKVNEPKNLARFEQREEEITVKGRTEPDTKVTINGQQIIVDQEGRFASLYALKDGKNKLRIEAEDLAGNKTTIERTFFFSRIF